MLAFTLGFQALVAAIHVHPFAATAPVAAGVTPAAEGGPGVPKCHDAFDCPLCLVLKGGSSYVPPAMLTLTLPCGASAATAVPVLPHARVATRSSAQPRAPPVLV